MQRRLLAAAVGLCTLACQPTSSTTPPADTGAAATTTSPDDTTPPAPPEEAAEFKVVADQFADLRVLRYRIPGFESLSLQDKQLAYYLYQAALSGRDMIWDQNYEHNLAVRRTLEAIIKTYSGERSGADWDALMVYAKRVWFSNGIHHHYSMKKIEPGFDAKYFATVVRGSDINALPLRDGEKIDKMLARLKPVMFDPKIDAKRVNLDPKVDMVRKSATNFYDGVTQKEVERFYASKADKGVANPVSWGLNSQLAKRDGKVVERTWKVGGMYSPAIEEIVKWLKLAITVAESPKQKKALQELVAFYETGELKKFDDYSIAWVADTQSRLDVVNGFIEVYGDPLGYRGAYESVVSLRDEEATKRMAALSAEAQWFEDHSSIPDEYKKKNVKGISAKVITVIVEAGDASPSTPIGINLPNSNWIRAEHGSKSVNLGNIVDAYDESSKESGVLEEFAASPEEVARTKAHGALADKLHTDLHEVIGHASGAIKEGVGTPKETLKNYSSTLEEGRADLVALYYLYDDKLVKLGVMPSLDVGKVAYDDYIRSAMLVQLARLEPGENIEEAHMRNRQMVAKWVIEKGKADNVIERVETDGKTTFRINDYAKLRTLFGDLLREVQRIKSEGDYEAGRKLVETYGVKVDKELHAQVLRRYKALNIAPYAGFINPRLVPVERDGKIVDVKVEYPDNFVVQMLEYAENYSFLPTVNN
jgi:dipeptidyl-peptidase-3